MPGKLDGRVSSSVPRSIWKFTDEEMHGLRSGGGGRGRLPNDHSVSVTEKSRKRQNLLLSDWLWSDVAVDPREIVVSRSVD